MQATMVRSAIAAATVQAIDLIQHHLDKEAVNRRQITLRPAELCPMQKAELVEDLSKLFR